MNEYQEYQGQILGQNPSGETKKVQVDTYGNLKTSVVGSDVMQPVEQQGVFRELVVLTTTVLGANAIYTSPTIDGQSVKGLTGYIESDKSGHLEIQASYDGTNWTTLKNLPNSGILEFDQKVYARYSRLKYINDSVAQTSFKLVAYTSVNTEGEVKTSITGSLVNQEIATIANGASLSGVVDLVNNSLVALSMPSAWTVASITFQVSNDNSNYGDLYYQGGEFTVSEASANRKISIDPVAFLGWRYLKVRSGTSGTPVNQTAQAIVTLCTKPI